MIDFLDFTEIKGLVFCNKPKSAKNNAELLYILEAAKLGVAAVFFRRYYQDSNPLGSLQTIPSHSEPAVCIFNVQDDFFNSEPHQQLHAALWSAGKNEVYVLIGKTRIDIVNARKPAPANKSKELSLESLRLASAAVGSFNDQRFSSFVFESGTFWEQPEFIDEIDENSSPYFFLLNYLMKVREVLFKSNLNLSAKTTDKLLITCILVKFLEDIRDDQGKHTLRNIYKKYKIENFAESIQNGVFLEILQELSTEFNGRIFDQFSQKERILLKESNLIKIAQFLKADIDVQTNQLFLWKQYSFKHLPPEVISAIYENFIQAESIRQSGTTEKGVVYTPIHLVNHLIDEVMPLNNPELFKDEQFRVLDPACGSGVFLVAAYRRLLQWWALNNSINGKIHYPKCKRAQKILENNIFGVDVKETATLVSIFGLTTALLDKLTPQEIWNNLRFNDLSQRNIQFENFFDWAIQAKREQKEFELIIGNPPFNLEFGKKKDQVIPQAILKQLDLNHKKIPNDNFALHFFEVSILLGKKVCMIIPSNILLYNKAAQKYRSQFFTNYTVSKIYDFTHLRRDLFHRSADTPVVAIIVDNFPSKQDDIYHIVVKRMVSSEKKIRFEIDYYDIHNVKWDWAVDSEKSFVWKTNLLGGGQLFQLIQKLNSLPTLKSFISSHTEWKCQRGFEGGSDIKLKNKKQIIGINNGQPEILNNVIITTGNLKNEEIYEPPFMIFDQIIGTKYIPTAVISSKESPTSQNIYYNRDFIGLKVPESDFNELENINSRFRNNKKKKLNYQLYILATSSNCLILHETAIRQGDLLGVPYPDDSKYLELSEAEAKIQSDVLNYYIHFGKSIGNQGAGKKLHVAVSNLQLSEYGECYCNALNEIYAGNGKSWQTGSIYKGNLCTAFEFGFGPNGGLLQEFIDAKDKQIVSFIQDKLSNNGTIFTRIVRLYNHQKGYDCVYLIKPNAILYWLNSIALRDASDTFFDLRQQGY